MEWNCLLSVVHPLVLFFAFVFHTLAIDDCANSINAALSVRLDGEGFHQNLATTLNFSSTHRLVDCVFVYAFQIPNGCFIDVDVFNRHPNKRLKMHCLTAERFVVEGPLVDSFSREQQFTTVYFHTTKIARKTFTFYDTLEFPIHFRYRRPIHSTANLDKGGFASVVIPQPQVFLLCDQQKSQLEIGCQNQIEKVPCYCKSNGGEKSMCVAVRLDSKAIPKDIETKIPVAYLDNVNCIVWMTIFLTFSFLFLIIKSAH